LLGTLSTDTSAVTQGRYDQVAGKAQSAVGSVKDAITSGADAVVSVDLSTLGDDVAKLTQTVSDLVQKQTSSARDQVMGRRVPRPTISLRPPPRRRTAWFLFKRISVPGFRKTP
jgi:hypothetical protein